MYSDQVDSGGCVSCGDAVGKRRSSRLARRLSLTMMGVLICLQASGFRGTGLRHAHAEEGSGERSPAATVQLQVTPSSCVALHRGQVCFQRLQLRWNNPEGRRLCLFHQPLEEALHCTTVSPAVYRHEYRSAESEVFILREAVSGEVLSTATVTTAWVYRTGKRSSSGWRLF
ncbi:DUF3019 domain-containing protein [Granulosicoccus sp. 3-233]|uniref:DUF3019 domain-containing protein n=1 Tax=Granulosicoccus sp. 3-233 TaxID=3417969 RepID=UPI003D349E3A